MAGDQQAVAVAGSLGDDGHDDHRRQAVLDETAQQAVLTAGQAIGELLDDVRRTLGAIAELDEADDMAVQAEHAVHVREVPLGEVGGERQRPEVRMVRRIGELQAHTAILPAGR